MRSSRHDPRQVSLISQYFYPEMISTGHILTELFWEFGKRGIKGRVICAQPTYYETRRVPSRLVYEGLEITRTRNTQYNKNAVVGKVLNSATFFFLAFLQAVREKSLGPLFLVTNPPMLGLMGPIIKAIRKRPFILIIHDLYPDIAVNAGYMTSNSLVARLWRLLNKLAFCRAAYTVVLGRDVRQVLRARLPKEYRDSVVYIPNWADPDLIEPVDRSENPLIARFGLKDKFVVQYSGNMGLTHDMETIIRAARVLKDDDSIHFLLIGGGGKLSLIKRMAIGYGLQNISFLPYQRRNRLKYTLGMADVGLISLESGFEGLSVPSKLYGIMASGKPSIAIMSEKSEVAMTLREFRCGLVSPPKDVSGLVGAITRLKEDEAERKEMGARAYEAFLENFTLQRSADKYYHLLTMLSSGRACR